MIALGLIRRQLEIGEDCAEEQPRAEFAADEIGMLALQPRPAAAASGFSITGAVSTNTLTRQPAAGGGDEPRGERLEFAFEHLVIVAVARIDEIAPLSLRARAASGSTVGP